MTVTKLRGFKITNFKRSKTVGIAAKSLNELLTKSCTKFNTCKKDSRLVLLDGTVVDNEDYFRTLPNQTVLMLQDQHQFDNTGAELIFNALKLVNLDIIRSGEAIQKFFDHNLKEKLHQLNKIVNSGSEEEEDRTKLSTREEDEDWFTGLDTNAKTKENFMFRRSQERIRGYLYKSRSDIRQSELYEKDLKFRAAIESVFSTFSELLKEEQYLGYYFDRSSDKALCDKTGEFYCRGAWNKESCARINLHKINPYESREARIVFSTWNLDHWIERSRSIIPSITEACSIVVAKQKPISILNHQYFYSLLFTVKNLKLVHIVCHDKGEHKTAKCDKEQYFVNQIFE